MSSDRTPAAVDEPRPGYLVVQADEGGTYVGGLMVTDGNGLPVDFRFTDPITPTRLQRALYGGALDRYLRADVVAATLLRSVEQRPTMVLVEEEDLLSLPEAGCPVALVDVSRSPGMGAPGSTRTEAPDRLLVQACEDGPPVRVVVSDPGSAGAVAASLTALGRRMDPMEPAQRVHAALALIAVGDTA